MSLEDDIEDYLENDRQNSNTALPLPDSDIYCVGQLYTQERDNLIKDGELPDGTFVIFREPDPGNLAEEYIAAGNPVSLEDWE